MEQISSLFWEIKKLPLAGGLVIGALAVGAPNLRVGSCSSFNLWAATAQFYF
jgi:hypothetical protein